MIDEELDKNVQTWLTLTELSVITGGTTVTDEYMGEWDKLLADREESQRSCEEFLSLPPEGLTEETQQKLAQFRKTKYPIVLCRLGRCYLMQERYADAREVFQQAADLGFRGGKMLLGLAYVDGAAEVDHASSEVEIQAALSAYETAYSLYRDADVLAEDAESQVENITLYKCIVSGLAALHRIIGNNLAASYDTYTYMLRYDWGEAFNDSYHAEAQEELRHFSKSVFGKLKYR